MRSQSGVLNAKCKSRLAEFELSESLFSFVEQEINTVVTRTRYVLRVVMVFILFLIKKKCVTIIMIIFQITLYFHYKTIPTNGYIWALNFVYEFLVKQYFLLYLVYTLIGGITILA